MVLFVNSIPKKELILLVFFFYSKESYCFLTLETVKNQFDKGPFYLHYIHGEQYIFIQNIFHKGPSSLQTAHGSHPVHYCMLPSVRPAWAKKQLLSTQLEGCLKGSFHEVYFKGDCCHTVCIQVGQMYSSRSLPVLFSSSVRQLSSPGRESDGLKPTRPQLIARY